jgi:hypothetical protein
MVLFFTRTKGHIHSEGTQKDNLLLKKAAKDYFGFLLHLLFHNYSGLIYDYNYNDVMLIYRKIQE